MRTRCAVIAAIAVLSAGATTRAADLFVNAFKYSDPAYQTNIEVDLAGVAGVTGVQAVMADSTVLALEPFGVGQYGTFTGLFSNIVPFQAATVGAWQLHVAFGAAGTAVYDFNVNAFRTPFTADSFPPAPTMFSPADGAGGVAPTPTFLWDNGGTHTGPLESLFVNVWSVVDPLVGQFESSFGPSLDLNDTAWTPLVILPAGPAMFLVQYETNENEDANVDDPAFNAAASTVADPGIVWATSSGDLFSRDLIGFEVVGEPATLLLLAVGAAGGLLLRRRPV